MVLYRFLFAPVLLAVAVFAGGDEHAIDPPAPPALSREAPAAAPESGPAAARRGAPVRDPAGPAPRLRAAR